MHSKNKQNLDLEELSFFEKNFYENFSKKQETYNGFLLKLLLIIGTVIYGYGYLLLKMNKEVLDNKTLFFMLLFTQTLLIIYFKIIYDEGYAFRRDQLIVLRILKKYGLIACNVAEEKDNKKVFTYYYNPLKKIILKNGEVKRMHWWQLFLLPAFHNTLAGAIFLIHCLLYFSFFFIVQERLYINIVIIMSVISILFTLIIVKRKNKWLFELYHDAAQNWDKDTYIIEKND